MLMRLTAYILLRCVQNLTESSFSKPDPPFHYQYTIDWFM